MALNKQDLQAIRQSLHQEAKSLATKKDLESLATKKELENLATKKDLESLATKKELENLATKKELEDLVQILSQAMQEHQDLVAGKLDRLERVISSWPAPSVIIGLVDRVSRLEKQTRELSKKVNTRA